MCLNFCKLLPDSNFWKLRKIKWFSFLYYIFLETSSLSTQHEPLGMCINGGKTLPWARSWPVLSTCCKEESFALFIPRDFTGCWWLSVPSSTNPWVHILLTDSFKRSSSIFVILCHHPDVIKYHSTESVNNRWTHQKQCTPEVSKRNGCFTQHTAGHTTT